MSRCVLLAISLTAAVHSAPDDGSRITFGQTPAAAPKTSARAMPRAIRRDVPMTNAIRRAYEAGTRDLSGRPGPNYWQLQADYAITVRLDPTSHTISGEEQITVHNNSPQELTQIVLRLDHNIYRPLVPRGFSVPAENTEGMVITKLVVNGDAVNLAAAPQGGRGSTGSPQAGQGQDAPRRLSASGLDQTVARITLAKPVAAKSKATLDIAWRTKLPGGSGGRGHRMTQRWDDTLFQPTQWFPRIAKYDDLRGWDTNPYLGPSVFYINFGRIDVRINVIAGWIGSGTGVLKNTNDVLTAQARERVARARGSDFVTDIGGA